MRKRKALRGSHASISSYSCVFVILMFFFGTFFNR